MNETETLINESLALVRDMQDYMSTVRSLNLTTQASTILEMAHAALANWEEVGIVAKASHLLDLATPLPSTIDGLANLTRPTIVLYSDAGVKANALLDAFGPSIVVAILALGCIQFVSLCLMWRIHRVLAYDRLQ